MTDEELWGEYQQLLHVVIDEDGDDDGVGGLPEGEFYWCLTHGEDLGKLS